MEHTMDSVQDDIDEFGGGNRLNNSFVHDRRNDLGQCGRSMVLSLDDAPINSTEIGVSRTDNTVENYGKGKLVVDSPSGLLTQFQDLSLVNSHSPSAASSSTTLQESDEMNDRIWVAISRVIVNEVRRILKDVGDKNIKHNQGRRKKRRAAKRANALTPKERAEVISILENLRISLPCQEKLTKKQSKKSKPNLDLKKPGSATKKKKSGSNLALGLLSMMEDLSLVSSSNDSATPSS